jgi:serine/threonine-protein kinase RsbT
MEILKSESVAITVQADVVRTRQISREWAVESGFKIVEQTKFVTAVSELARNTLIHGKGGFMLLEALKNNLRKGLRATFEDRGPGIPDIDKALQDGFTTGQGLGLGLGGAQRLSDEFAILTKPGEGTRVTIARWI